MTILTVWVFIGFNIDGFAWYMITVCPIWLITLTLFDLENKWKSTEKI